MSYRNNKKIKSKSHNNVLEILFPDMEQWKNISLKLCQEDPTIKWQGKNEEIHFFVTFQKDQAGGSVHAVIQRPNSFYLGSWGFPKTKSSYDW